MKKPEFCLIQIYTDYNYIEAMPKYDYLTNWSLITTANTILCSTWNGRFIFHHNEGVKLSYNQLIHPLWSLCLTYNTSM